MGQRTFTSTLLNKVHLGSKVDSMEIKPNGEGARLVQDDPRPTPTPDQPPPFPPDTKRKTRTKRFGANL